MITKETATDIAMTYREIEVAEKLLADVKETMEQSPFGKKADLRDVFGRQHAALELGVPSGDTSKRLFRLPYKLAVPVIQAHIAEAKARLEALAVAAEAELKGKAK